MATQELLVVTGGNEVRMSRLGGLATRHLKLVGVTNHDLLANDAAACGVPLETPVDVIRFQRILRCHRGISFLAEALLQRLDQANGYYEGLLNRNDLARLRQARPRLKLIAFTPDRSREFIDKMEDVLTLQEWQYWRREHQPPGPRPNLISDGLPSRANFNTEAMYDPDDEHGYHVPELRDEAEVVINPDHSIGVCLLNMKRLLH